MVGWRTCCSGSGGPSPGGGRPGRPPPSKKKPEPLAAARGTERTHMSVVELQELEEVKGLVAKGQQVGVLTYAEIADAVSELDLDESDVEELHGFFEKSEIELVEDIDP